MNSRERVRAVLNKEVPDRVPLGLGGCETAGLHLLAYERLNELLDIKDIKPRLDTFMVNAVFEKETIIKMEGDIILLDSPRMCKAPLWDEGYEQHWKEQELWGKTFRVPVTENIIKDEDGSMSWGKNRFCPQGSLYFDSTHKTDLYAEYVIPDPSRYNPPHELNEDLLRRLEKTAKFLYDETEFSICCGETITDLQIQPGGFINYLILLKEDPDIIKEILHKSVEAAVSQLKQLEQAIGKYTDILSIAHDLGDNRDVQIGSELFREIYKPYYKKLFQEWHKITNMKVNLHSCGAIAKILPDLIECGLDIYNPVQLSAENMDPKTLKSRFGGSLVFYGGAYDAQAIPYGADYNYVYNSVKSNIDILKEGGGYIAAGVHNLPGDMPKEHLKAMLDAFYDVRYY